MSKAHLNIQIHNGITWIHSDSIAFEENKPFSISCVSQNTTTNSTEILELRLKTPHNSEWRTLQRSTNNSLQWSTSLRINDSGTYKCLLGSFSTSLTLVVYRWGPIIHAEFPTITKEERIGSYLFNLRDFDHEKILDREQFWLFCSCTFSIHLSLDAINVEWDGGLLDVKTNQTELATLYTKLIQRNSSQGSITTMIRLNTPIFDQRAYGEYRCIFTIHQNVSVIGRAYLRVAPILRIHYDPPPVPTNDSKNSSACRVPHCTGNASTVAWTQACEIVAAYPPVGSDITWSWTHPDWAKYAIKRAQSIGKSAYYNELVEKYGLVAEPTTNPWSILERKRRHVDENEIQSNAQNFPTEPTIFWCWAKNSLGESVEWWPGTFHINNTSVWTSISWAILGVVVEMLSLLMVFGYFRYCHPSNRLCGFTLHRSTSGLSIPMTALDEELETSDKMVDVNTSGGPNIKYSSLKYQRLNGNSSDDECTQGVDIPESTHGNEKINGYSNPTV